MAERRQPLDRAEHQPAAELDPVPDRRQVGQELERERHLGDREERPREEEHRDDHEAEDRREAPTRTRSCAAYAAMGIENAVPIRTATGIASRPSHELTAPKAATMTKYAALAMSTRVTTKSWWPSSTSARSAASRHRVVGPRPLDRAHHRPARLGRRRLHRGRGEQARRDVVEVGNAARRIRRLVDDRASPTPSAAR